MSFLESVFQTLNFLLGLPWMMYFSIRDFGNFRSLSTQQWRRRFVFTAVYCFNNAVGIVVLCDFTGENSVTVCFFLVLGYRWQFGISPNSFVLSISLLADFN